MGCRNRWHQPQRRSARLCEQRHLGWYLPWPRRQVVARFLRSCRAVPGCGSGRRRNPSAAHSRALPPHRAQRSTPVDSQFTDISRHRRRVGERPLSSCHRVLDFAPGAIRKFWTYGIFRVRFADPAIPFLSRRLARPYAPSIYVLWRAGCNGAGPQHARRWSSTRVGDRRFWGSASRFHGPPSPQRFCEKSPAMSADRRSVC